MKELFAGGGRPQAKHRQDTRVQVADLVLVDFRTKKVTGAGQTWEDTDVKAWKDAHAVPYAESCSRQIWYGSQQDFTDFPFAPDITKLEGADAYNLLLRIASGYESDRICETHVRHQLYDGFRVFQADHPEKAKDYQALMKMLKTDLNFVTEKITSQFKTRREEYSALDLNGQKKGDKILVIAGETRHGGVTELTVELAKVCESRQRPDRNFLTITHPDPQILEETKQEIRRLQDQRVIRMEINFLPFDDLERAIDGHDQVYNAMSMGMNSEADARIINAWQNRSRDDNSLACFRGNPQNRGASNPEWTEADLDNYLSPEEIRADMIERFQTNKDVLERGSQAFKVCGNLRAMGLHPRHNMPETLAEKLKLNI